MLEKSAFAIHHYDPKTSTKPSKERPPSFLFPSRNPSPV